MITRVAIFDFDGTLFQSPQPPGWWKKTNWFRDSTSLDPPCVPKRPDGAWWNKRVVGQARKSASDGLTLTVLLTGRWGRVFGPRIRELVKQQGLSFDRVMLPSSPGAAAFKGATLNKILDTHPDVTEIDVFDDYADHTRIFTTIGHKRSIKVNVNHVSYDPHKPDCPSPVESRRGRLGLMKICEGLILDPTTFREQVLGLRHVSKARLLNEADAKPLGQGQLKQGQKLPFGQGGNTIFVVTRVNAKKATLERATPSTVDVGPKLRGKGGKMTLTWDGTGYGKNALKRVRPGQTMPKYYARPDGIY